MGLGLSAHTLFTTALQALAPHLLAPTTQTPPHGEAPADAGVHDVHSTGTLAARETALLLTSVASAGFLPAADLMEAITRRLALALAQQPMTAAVGVGGSAVGDREEQLSEDEVAGILRALVDLKSPPGEELMQVWRSV